MKIILGDFNGKVGRDNIFNRIVNFAISKNLVVKSTMFLHQYIHKYTWTSPDGKDSQAD